MDEVVLFGRHRLSEVGLVGYEFLGQSLPAVTQPNMQVALRVQHIAVAQRLNSTSDGRLHRLVERYLLVVLGIVA